MIDVQSLSSPAVLVLDLLRYGGLGLVSVGAGLALLRLFRVPIAAAGALTLAPAVTLSFWAVLLGFGVSIGWPVRAFSLPVWLLTLGLAGYGLMTAQAELRRSDWRAVSVAAALPVVLMAPYFAYGLKDFVGSALPDGWGYVAMGQYLWTYPIGTEGGLAPLHQYASHMSHVRHVSGAMLAFMSPLYSPGDTQAPCGLFLAHAVFILAASCAFFATAAGWRFFQLLVYVVLVVLSGWTANVVWANNFDNALALSYAPVLAGVALQLDLASWGWRILIGLLAAGLFYIYPELAPMVTALAIFIAIERWFRTARSTLKQWALVVATSGTLALALTWPFVPDMVAFVSMQTSAGLQQQVARPGEGMFGGLLWARFHPSAFWGLGGEFLRERWLVVGQAFGLLLSALAAIGVFHWLRTRLAGLAAWLVLLVTAALMMMVVSQDLYGAYKLLLLAWWALAAAVIAGVERLASMRQLAPHSATIRRAAGTVLIAAALTYTGARTLRDMRVTNTWNMADYRQAAAIADLHLPAKVVVAVDEYIAGEWAVYHLRSLPVRVASYRMYMSFPHIRPLMERARAVPAAELGYVLTDDHPEATLRTMDGWSLVWSGGPYRLWKPRHAAWALVTGVTNPYGLEQVGGKPFFWLGPAPASIDVYSSADGVLALEGGFIAGPSAAGASRRLQITTADGEARALTVGVGTRSIRIPVRAGHAQIRVAPLDAPTQPAPNGDPRALLLGIQDLRAALDPRPGARGELEREDDRSSGVVIERIDNRNGLETVDGKPFLWIGGPPTIFHVRADRPGELWLSGKFVLGPSVLGLPVRRLQLSNDSGFGQTVTVGNGDQVFRIPVPAGASRVLLTPLDERSLDRQPNGDLRPLILGMSTPAATLHDLAAVPRGAGGR